MANFAILHQPAFSFALTPYRRCPKRAKASPISHASRPELKKGNVAHVTIKPRKGLPSLRVGEALDVLRAAVGRVNGGSLVRIVEFSIQSNHVCMLVEAPNSAALSRGMASLNTGLGMRLNRVWNRTGQGSVFVSRFHFEVISTRRQMRNALNYILQNDVHHGLGLNTLDPCSSAPSLGGWKELLGSDEVAQATAACVGAEAQTWLLPYGSQKAKGLLSTNQKPSIDMTSLWPRPPSLAPGRASPLTPSRNRRLGPLASSSAARSLAEAHPVSAPHAAQKAQALPAPRKLLLPRSVGAAGRSRV